MAAKKSRSGSKYFHGDDLTKTGADAKRRSTTEPWEKSRKSGAKAAKTAKTASKSSGRTVRKAAKSAKRK